PELGVDLNRDGKDGLLRSRAFDLNLGRLIAGTDGSPRQEVGGSVLAFSHAVGPGGSPPDVLGVYDATHPETGASLVRDATHASFFVTRNAGDPTVPAGDNDVLPTNPVDFAVAAG